LGTAVQSTWHACSVSDPDDYDPEYALAVYMPNQRFKVLVDSNAVLNLNSVFVIPAIFRLGLTVGE